jgi:hypothetical protein
MPKSTFLNVEKECEIHQRLAGTHSHFWNV